MCGPANISNPNPSLKVGKPETRLILKIFFRFIGPLTSSQISGVRFRITDGDNHCVDSTEIAFQMCTELVMRDCELISFRKFDFGSFHFSYLFLRRLLCASRFRKRFLATFRTDNDCRNICSYRITRYSFGFGFQTDRSNKIYGSLGGLDYYCG